MPTNLGVTMSFKNNEGDYISLHPKTVKEQILDWNVGEVFGPYSFTLTANGWVDNLQTVELEGITENDIPYCLKILSGTQEEMIAQDQAYSLLDPITGIESLNNQVRFKVKSVPTIDFQVQISWTR